MSSQACASPLSFERFVDYWFGDLPSAEQESLEEHLFVCPSCGKNAEVWADDLQTLGDTASELPRPFLTTEQLAALGNKATVVDVTTDEITVHLRPHTIHVFRVSLDEAQLSGLERLDVEYLKEGVPEPIFHVSGVPLEAESGQFHFACHSHVLNAHGDAKMRLLGTRQGQQFTVLESTMHMHGLAG
ncbi:MAG TPA: zf-HC2 domain-containing protein [Polyangiaceae bacterium]|jgi:hypothetical protein|nr:zf-HC2 domain-containing protein [Polyangiaceae bacterium]